MTCLAPLLSLFSFPTSRLPSSKRARAARGAAGCWVELASRDRSTVMELWGEGTTLEGLLQQQQQQHEEKGGAAEAVVAAAVP